MTLKQLPLLMSAPMMRATLNDEKHETRRPMKYHPTYGDPAKLLDRDPAKLFREVGHLCPYGQPGRLLWLRETWAVDAIYDKVKPRDLLREGWNDNTGQLWFRSTCAPGTDRDPLKGRWRASIHMPRFLSRVTIKMTSLALERVRDITPEAVVREGVKVPATADHIPLLRLTGRFPPTDYLPDKKNPTVNDLAVAEFASLWESIHGAGSWEADHLVWVIGFDVCDD